ncbi:MAG: phage portal protein [Pusillimonas sp.]|nr:phage portal protein [Pusillimonas sp.]
MSDIKAQKPGRIKSALLNWLGVPVALVDGTFWSAYFGTESYSGKEVTVSSALQLSTVWACVNLISRTVATLPLNLYRRLPDGGREVARNHALYGLLHDMPNPDMTSSTFRQVMMAHLLLWGNAYIEKKMIGNRIVSLVPLQPALVSKKRRANGAFFYVYTNEGKQREIAERNMMHIPAFSMDGYMGLSVIGCARQIFGNAMAADEASGKTFANGMKASGLVTMDMVLKPEQRNDIRKHVKTVSDSGGVMVLEKGTGFQQLSMNPQDAELLSTREFGVEEIARWFGVPPHMIGHTAKTTSWGAGIEQQNLGFLTYVLETWIDSIEKAITKDLIDPAQRSTYYAEHVLDGLLRSDSTGRAALYASASQNGWMDRAEIREKENLPKREGTDTLTVQSNLTPLENLGQSTASETVRAALRSWLSEDTEKPDDKSKDARH